MSATVKAIRVHRSRRSFLRAELAAPRRPPARRKRLTAPSPARPARLRPSRRSPRGRYGASGVRAVLPPASAALPRLPAAPAPPPPPQHFTQNHVHFFLSPNPSKLFILDLKLPFSIESFCSLSPNPSKLYSILKNSHFQ
ncbi:unnamed protein product [Rangifer tarandus platyrhynchus]|uniref:Uncharacterized protein n=2 Tax=Rangifer tarandus platyrhynchus TaxID=3082113 RepID=A0AC59ZL50_RANTA|nr:unnamed protein product [Rangifer tarandus platyrhynchus]